MLSIRLWRSILIVSFLSVLVAVAGCGGDKDKPSGAPSGDPKAPKDTGGVKAPPGERTAIQASGTATLKGKVTYAGATVPERKDLKVQMQAQGDSKHCLQGDVQSQEWIVSPDKGVANVVVWLKAPSGKYFDVPSEMRKRGDNVTMDQPFCQFEPHVVAFNPSCWDAQSKKQVKTGQTLKVLNSAPINHNTSWRGSALFGNTGVNQLLAAKKGELPVDAKPCKDNETGKEDLLTIACDIHKWMGAKVVVFDHPYYAVTKADGTYEIKNAPAGAEVEVVYWHESMETLAKAPREKITLSPGENPPRNFEVGK